MGYRVMCCGVVKDGCWAQTSSGAYFNDGLLYTHEVGLRNECCISGPSIPPSPLAVP
jgi:hypothetical protein